MIVCKQCGAHNQSSDTFCGSCGSFLEWTGESIKKPVIDEEVVKQAEEEAKAPKRGLLARVQSMIYSDVGKAKPMERAAGMGAPGMPGRPGMPGAPPGMPGRPGPPGMGARSRSWPCFCS
ncbi:hypothetical protein AB0885_04275, partial [Streptomyces sp. NPDC005534]